MAQIVNIESTDLITHNVLRIVTQKPEGWSFIPGQATEISINQPDWEKKKRPFTFTSLPEEDFLEFTIKTYPQHNGVTNRLLSLKKNDELILHDVFGSIHYQGEGLFVAGGAGITPFLAIFRDLKSKNLLGNNRLLFANKTSKDIILKKELTELFGDKFVNVLSEEKNDMYFHGYITPELIKETAAENTKYYYLCGPRPMMKAMEEHFGNLEIAKENIIKEKF